MKNEKAWFLAGIGIVLVTHLFALYADMSGLAVSDSLWMGHNVLNLLAVVLIWINKG